MTYHSPRRFAPNYQIMDLLKSLQPVENDVRAMTYIRASWVIAQIAVALKRTLGETSILDTDHVIGSYLLRGLEVTFMDGLVNQSDMDFFYLSGVVPNDRIHLHKDIYSQARINNGVAMRNALHTQLSAMGMNLTAP